MNKYFGLMLLTLLFNFSSADGIGTMADFKKMYLTGNINDSLTATVFKNTGSTNIYGLYISGVYTNATSCTTTPTSSTYSVSNIADSVGFWTSQIPISTTTGVEIYSNALYQTIWNSIGQANSSTMPSSVQAIVAGLIVAAPGSSGLTPTTQLATGTRASSPSFTTRVSQILTTANNNCILVSCNNSTQSCTITNNTNLKIN
jgi:hypothetical protein